MHINTTKRLLIGERFIIEMFLTDEEVEKLGWFPQSTVVLIDDDSLSMEIPNISQSSLH